MIVLLQSVNVLLMTGLLILIVTGLLGKLPGRLVYLAGIGVSGVLFVAAVIQMDPFTIMCQGVAVVCWTVGFIVRRRTARAQAQATQQ